MIYTKNNPSPFYTSLIDDYKNIHINGTANRSPEDTYNGLSTISFAEILKKIILKNKCKTLFDYGSGKGDRYFKHSEFAGKTFPPLKEYWNVEASLYDPGIMPVKPKNKKFDIVISIDVLEHIPFEDLNWVINEIFEYAKDIVFLNIACYPAKALLPNGKNAHVSVFDPWWWSGYISAIASKYELKTFLVCTYFKNKKKTYFSYSINDNFNQY